MLKISINSLLLLATIILSASLYSNPLFFESYNGNSRPEIKISLILALINSPIAVLIEAILELAIFSKATIFGFNKVKYSLLNSLKKFEIGAWYFKIFSVFSYDHQQLY
ncbi:hypothetical protein [Mycoplasmopsis fermentans]|uniref:hypothetical protein n=1 Tax=Mycoplasmopsis fermentans TaxID=2115 RepID=UPI00218075DE|nr:hypothetical protein [Mycoplasmopsis fermentans]